PRVCDRLKRRAQGIRCRIPRERQARHHGPVALCEPRKRAFQLSAVELARARLRVGVAETRLLVDDRRRRCVRKRTYTSVMVNGAVDNSGRWIAQYAHAGVESSQRGVHAGHGNTCRATCNASTIAKTTILKKMRNE